MFPPAGLAELLNRARIDNIMGAQSMGNQQAPVDPGQPDVTPNFQSGTTVPDLMNSPLMAAFQPKSDITDMLTNALQNMPQRTDYPEPGLWTKIRGSLAAVGAGSRGDVMEGEKTKDYIRNKDYYRDVGDWKTKVDALSKGATDENRVNNMMRQAITAAGSQDVANRRVDVSKERADAYVKLKEFEMSHPDYKPILVRGGNIIYYNPKDPAAPPIDSKISSGLIDEGHKLQIQHGNRISEIETQGAVQSGLIHERGEEARKTKEVVPGKADSTTNATPTQEKIRQYTKARQAILEHPEWAKFIHLDTAGANTFSVDSSSGYWGGPDKATHDQIANYILGTKSTSPTGKPDSTTKGAGPTTGKTMTDPKTGHTYDVSTWSTKDLEEAKKRGWK